MRKIRPKLYKTAFIITLSIGAIGSLISINEMFFDIVHRSNLDDILYIQSHEAEEGNFFTIHDHKHKYDSYDDDRLATNTEIRSGIEQQNEHKFRNGKEEFIISWIPFLILISLKAYFDWLLRNEEESENRKAA